MIKAYYFYKENDHLNDFMKRQLESAYLGKTEVHSFSIDKNPTLVKKYDITSYYSLIFINEENDEVVVSIRRPFSSSEASGVAQFAHFRKIFEGSK